MPPVTIALDQLPHAPASVLEEAFGPNSLGILLVSGLSPEYAQLRQTVLDNARALANLPPAQLANLELPQTLYQTGWSRGREKLASGQPDTDKGSFYVNCNFVRRPELDGPDASTLEKFPNNLENAHLNVWPDIDGFERTLKALISYMVAVTIEVARACDRALKHQIGDTCLEELVANSDAGRARLLHYYKPEHDESNWCGDHVDHSCLTALTSALWGPGAIDEPLDGAGLYIRARDGTTVKVRIPPDCIAIQSGSALEALSNGKFKGVPHRVVGDRRYYRSTLAVFSQPRLDAKIGSTTFSEFATQIIKQFNPINTPGTTS